MEKPVKPIEPQFKDFPQEKNVTDKSPFIVAYKNWLKEKEKYEKEIELYHQTKMIKDIQRSTLKLALKKYKVIEK
jgi:hypothetical protein